MLKSAQKAQRHRTFNVQTRYVTVSMVTDTQNDYNNPCACAEGYVYAGKWPVQIQWFAAHFEYFS